MGAEKKCRLRWTTPAFFFFFATCALMMVAAVQHFTQQTVCLKHTAQECSEVKRVTGGREVYAVLEGGWSGCSLRSCWRSLREAQVLRLARVQRATILGMIVFSYFRAKGHTQPQGGHGSSISVHAIAYAGLYTRPRMASTRQ